MCLCVSVCALFLFALTIPLKQLSVKCTIMYVCISVATITKLASNLPDTFQLQS